MSHAAHDQQPADIEALYRRFGPMVLRRGRRFFAADGAEDVLHEVFIRVLERYHDFRHAASPATWLFTITTRLCLNRLRDARRRGALLAEHGPTAFAQALESRPDSAIFLKQVWRAVLEADEELAMIATLYHLDGLTTADIGAMLGVTDRTIANRLARIATIAASCDAEDTAPGGTP